jgi:ATP-binding cassette, subfamily C (CFTR/MRP), member 1
MVFTVQYYEHWRSRVPNSIVLFYWLFLLIAMIVKLRSLVSQQLYRTHLAYFVTFTVGVGFAVVEFILESMVPKENSMYRSIEEEEECPFEYANVFSVLTFSWMTPLMKYGYKQYLTEEDLWNLRKRDTTQATYDSFQKEWEKELAKKNPSLWFALFRGFGGPYARGALVKTASDILTFVQPQLLRLLIAWVASYKTEDPQPVIRGAAIAIAMFVVSVTQTACLHQYFQRSFETGMRIKSALTAAIYAKSMRLSNEGRSSKSTGDIVNYMAVDTQRLQDLSQFGMQLWSAPLQIFLCLLSLYNLVGLSMLAGLGVMVAMVPLNGLIARVMKNLQKRQMKNKDARTRLVTEVSTWLKIRSNLDR